MEAMRYIIYGLRRFDNLLAQTAKILTAMTIFIQAIIMFAGVIFRYFLNSPLTWADELSSYLLIPVTFLGGYVALKMGLLAKIELFINLFSSNFRKGLILIAYVFVIIFMWVIFYFGMILTTSPVVLKQVSPAMEIPMYWFYSIIPLGALMILVHLIIEMYDMLQKRGNS